VTERQPTSVLDFEGPRRLGSSSPTVAVTEAEKPERAWRGQRVLTIDGKAAFELSYWCGTCPFVFKRLVDSNRTLSIEGMTDRLDAGLALLDELIVTSVAALLPEGDYMPLLLEIQPRLVFPGDEDDYFSKEQVTTWGVDAFWGLPEDPRVPYYRTPSRVIDEGARLYEFVVPLVPPNWNEPERVELYVQRLRSTSRPTALALGVLDVRQRAVGDTPAAGIAHWGLTHFLLDGHHKIEAAARIGGMVRLLSLLAVDASLASREAVEQLPSILRTAAVDSVGGREGEPEQ
jgi:hypothetical protein